MIKKIIILLVCCLLSFPDTARADKEFIQKVMGKAETVQKKATAAQEKIMSYKKKMEEYAKKAKDMVADAQKLKNDVQKGINDAKSMANAAMNGDFSSLNVMPAELKTAISDAQQMKKEATDKVKEAQDTVAEAKSTASAASALASKTVSDAKSQVNSATSKVSGTVSSTTGETKSLGSAVNTINLSAGNSIAQSITTQSVSNNITASVKTLQNTQRSISTLASQPQAMSENTSMVVSQPKLLETSQAKEIMTEETAEDQNDAQKQEEKVNENSLKIETSAGMRKAFIMPTINDEASISEAVEVPAAEKTIETPLLSTEQTKSKPILSEEKVLIEPAEVLQKNSFWMGEEKSFVLKISQTETLKFADEAVPDVEEVSSAYRETFVPKEGTGDSVKIAREAKEKIQDYMRDELTTLYAAAFTIRTNMMKEPENRDVDKTAEDQIWQETILKAENCITRISKIHTMAAMTSSYKNSEALQELVIEEAKIIESEDE